MRVCGCVCAGMFGVPCTSVCVRVCLACPVPVCVCGYVSALLCQRVDRPPVITFLTTLFRRPYLGLHALIQYPIHLFYLPPLLPILSSLTPPKISRPETSPPPPVNSPHLWLLHSSRSYTLLHALTLLTLLHALTLLTFLHSPIRSTRSYMPHALARSHTPHALTCSYTPDALTCSYTLHMLLHPSRSYTLLHSSRSYTPQKQLLFRPPSHYNTKTQNQAKFLRLPHPCPISSTTQNHKKMQSSKSLQNHTLTPAC